MTFLLMLGNQSPLHEDLLDSARRFIEETHYAVAVVLAQTACEVFTEQVRAQLIQKRQLSAIGDWIAERTRRADLRNDALQGLYVALTNDRITQAPLWKDYDKHVDRRNNVVHRGFQISREEAEASCEVVGVMIAHLKAVMVQIVATEDR